jgi:DNA mismatch repair ATPase MutS
MSGKSTFLRTIGTNLVLAMTGAPVFASSFVFQPIAIASSIRTSDSLARHESYFYAELKRLKEILEELAKGAPLLILLDEILKGTNSYDKQNGSVALIKQLMKYKPIGLFATHDLELGNLRTAYPENIQNLCFEISIEDNKLFIDYKLRPGVCSTLNASYLMKQMGITEE